jgi:phosphohistidine phosphatase SixA
VVSRLEVDAKGERVFVLVRHAHAGEKKTWPEADNLRPLSEAGLQQAEGLAENLLALMRPARLLASPYLRCNQTLMPLAKRSGRVVQPLDLLVPEASPSALDRYLSGSDHDLTVYCTHGETLKALFARWLEQGSIQLLADGDPVSEPRTEKGAAWLVLTDKPRLAHYLRPLYIGPALEGAS